MLSEIFECQFMYLGVRYWSFGWRLELVFPYFLYLDWRLLGYVILSMTYGYAIIMSF